MKINKFAKISLLVLMLTLAIGAMFVMSTGASSAEKPEIISQNVEYTDKFALMYAVDASTVSGNSCTLNVYKNEPADGVAPAKSYTVSTVTLASGNLEKDSYVFTTEGVAATILTQNFYVQAVDANGKKSDVKRYSVAEYLYERLASGKASASQTSFYNSTIAFGASTEEIIGKESDSTKWISNYRYVTVEGGTIDGKYSAGVYPIGTVLTPVFAAGESATEWSVVTYSNLDGKATVTTTSSTVEVKDTVKNLVSSASGLIPYRFGTETFEDYAAADAVPATLAENRKSGSTAYSATMEFVETDDRGTVLKTVSGGRFGGIQLYKNSALVSADEATAIEISFDIKMTPNAEYSSVKTILFEMQPRYGEDLSVNRVNIYARRDGKTDNLRICQSSSPATYGDKVFYYTNSTDWINVRVVMYDNDTTIYVYINGNETPAEIKLQSSEYTGDISTITEFEIFAPHNPADETDPSKITSSGVGTEVLIDNLFFGYTMETKPTAN